MTLRVLILHNAVAADASAADADVLVQADVVAEACAALGHTPLRLGCSLNLAELVDYIARQKPDVVFNLVESLGGSDRLAALVPALLAARGVPFTGSSQAALDLTNDKPAAKRRIRDFCLPTADWVTLDQPASAPFRPGRYILKAIGEHASVGIDDGAIRSFDSRPKLLKSLAGQADKFPSGIFAERFIEGREFNLSVLAGPSAPQVLPPAEIDFSAFPDGKPRIVGYHAKWTDDSFEFANTPRTFTFSPDDESLLRQLRYLAKACWNAFGLTGYARVDFRVDAAGQPWILEINTNPCLSPDAGFAAALLEAGIDFPTAVQSLLVDALSRRTRGTTAFPAVSSSGATVHTGTSSPSFRTNLVPTDANAVRRIVAATEKFRPAEIDVAVELVDERLAKGAASGYEFVFAEDSGEVVGYTCYGKIAVTVASYDLYWIAVDPRLQARGLGKRLLHRTEQAIRSAGGERVYIETSGRPDYWATRAFYESCGYTFDSRVANFYAPGDDKVLYVKTLA